jgi:glutamine synthetase adenylyltransferase
MQPSPENSPFIGAQKTAQEIGLKLDQILEAIMPLHELLLVQKATEEGLTQRLKEILQSFSNIATHLETAAEALTQLAEADELPKAEAQAFQALQEKIAAQDERIEALHRDLKEMMSWLSTPMDRSPERR